ncbi:MAG: HD domain-containing protein [Pseudomonadota bacterium]
MSTLEQQIAFLTEIDRLKQVNRANHLIHTARPENTAEHSWHVALWALVFGVDQALDEILPMLLVHDIVEIDAGDHPIFEDHDPAEIATKEAKAAERLYGLLPSQQGAFLRSTWERFDNSSDPAAQFARRIDHAAPVWQDLASPDCSLEHKNISRWDLTEGRARHLANSFPEFHGLMVACLEGGTLDDSDTAKRLAFLAEACRLKEIKRATPCLTHPRRENTAEHSWHLAMFALVLQGIAETPINITEVLTMLILHDIVEIDAGDTPIHGQTDPHQQAAAEAKAADRIYGLLPQEDAARLRSIWERFEEAQSPEAVFAKALDRAQPVLANLSNGGGTWPEYKVTRSQLEARVGEKVMRGAPKLWAYLTPKIDAYFAQLPS